jgi:hypothetical protein
MAESKNNVITHGLSGKFGDLVVFRQKAGKTLATKAPGSRTGEPSEAQMVVRQRFQSASIYAKSVNADPVAKEEYKAAAQNGQSPYNVAFADFFRAPDILEINISNYTGQAGQVIHIKVTDDFKVKTVKVQIHNDDGSLVEEGLAVQTGNGPDWTYTTTAVNSNLGGDKITIMATDNPANLTTEELMLQ